MEFPPKLKVAYLPNKHILQIANNTAKTLTGIEGKLLQTVSDVLKFELELVIPPRREFGAISSDGVNWTGLIGMVQTQEADLAIGSLSVTYDRLGVVDFSSPYTVQDVTFLIKSPEQFHDANHLFSPFGFWVWMSILIVLAVIPAVFGMLVSERLTYGRLFFEMLGSLLKQPVTFSREPARVKPLFCLWSFFTLVITSCYSSILLSFLTTPLLEKSISSLEQLSWAVKNDGYRCLAEKGSSIPKIMRSAEQPHLKHIGESILEHSWNYQISDFAEGKVSLQKTVVFNVNFKLQMIKSMLDTDAIEISKDIVTSWTIALAVRKGFYCKTLLDRTITRIVEVGLLDKFQADEWYKLSLSSQKESIPKKKVARGLMLKEVFSSFLVLGSGMVVSGIAFVFECVWFRICENENCYNKHMVRKKHKSNKRRHSKSRSVPKKFSEEILVRRVLKRSTKSQISDSLPENALHYNRTTMRHTAFTLSDEEFF
ncbi:hypothetical protein JTE90_005335 [Oedothorax gibbosus]|uniref:Ionotropic glutamate receptor L-glutamate and glycine-binding domain-containing protein n=1 Tax=Oedothorax gibbosus TaxID=931172 RepID=A0AAV6UJC7_9ARAC|nr:hypothetical protein JTE90_005335 [Oedothorax gibbosus]